MEHIIQICEARDIEKEKQEEWVKHVRNGCIAEAHYFMDMIYTLRLSPYLILHEYMHHIAKILKQLTNSSIWFSIDVFIDLCDVVMFK